MTPSYPSPYYLESQADRVGGLAGRSLMTAFPSLPPPGLQGRPSMGIPQNGMMSAGARSMMENEYVTTTPSMILQSAMASAMQETNTSMSGGPPPPPPPASTTTSTTSTTSTTTTTTAKPEWSVGEPVMPSSSYQGSMMDPYCKELFLNRDGK